MPDKSPFRIIGISDEDVKRKIESAHAQLFYGNPAEERICFPTGELSYIEDIGHGDIRSEGMSYGMFIAARLGLETEFSALWNFSKQHLQNTEGDYAPYFAWQVAKSPGTDFHFYKIDKGAAPDGEEYFAAALLIAAEKFDHPEYKHEAVELLNQMVHKPTRGKVRALFDPENHLVRFSPMEGNDFTDPSYHTLAFYRLFYKATGDSFWEDAYAASLSFLKKAIHPSTGLSPDYAKFDGTPKHTDFFPTSECFSGDAWRVALNLAQDFQWEIPGVCEELRGEAKKFERDAIRNLLTFFASQDFPLADYRIDGGKFPTEPRAMTPGLLAMNAAATLALDFENPADKKLAAPILEAFFKEPVPRGKWRYYDGMLYMLGLLALSPD